jgi:hypothetical protein
MVTRTRKPRPHDEVATGVGCLPHQNLWPAGITEAKGEVAPSPRHILGSRPCLSLNSRGCHH